jgi:hypothetical protein
MLLEDRRIGVNKGSEMGTLNGKRLAGGKILRTVKWTAVTILVTGVLFTGSCLFLSYKYDVSPYFAARSMTRQGALEMIALGTHLYDPSKVITPSFGPETDACDESSSRCVRLENYLQEPENSNKFSVNQIDNQKILYSRYKFRYQPYEDPVLKKIREKYKLDEVVASAKDELQSIVLLRNWARSRFRRKDYQPYMENFNALEVLERNLKNPSDEPFPKSSYRPCHFAPLFLSQILISMGYNVRLVQISEMEKGGYNGHGMTEVWSNQYLKWITMDADLNLHYQRNGVPLNLLELHNERYKSGPTDIHMVYGEPLQLKGEDRKKYNIEHMIKYHSYIQIIDMRNDWLTNHYFKGHPLKSDNSALLWVDDNLPPVFRFRPKTSDIADFYWTLNQTEIMVKKQDKEGLQLALAFRTFTPNFKHFEIVIDDRLHTESELSDFTWAMHPGVNTISVRSVNKFGVPGITSFANISVKS